MLRNAPQSESIPVETGPKQALPSFMQEGARTHAPAPEPVELISANDLPDWIRQIAEADAAKAAAEAAQAAQTAAAAADVSETRRPLPGEAPVAAAPSTSWLSKSSTSQESSDPWATTDQPAAASWSASDPAAQQHSAYPTISPSSWTPSAYEDPGTGKKGRFGRSQRSSSPGEPVYKNRIVQLAFLVLLLALLAAMVL
jgi:hypothetical protein